MSTEKLPEPSPQIPAQPQRLGLLSLLVGVVLTAMAGGMAWGIRGQYGHESGAMMAGALTGFTLILIFVPRARALTAARAVAMMTVAIGIGGSMTYGQTLGLTHDPPLVGNVEALRWGLLGCFIKGGIWIGFGGAFLGMGLGGKKYRPFEMAVLVTTLFGLMLLGIWLINRPFDPANKILPTAYFSDDWYFEPEPEDPPEGFQPIKPRPEMWGGLLVALVGLIAYTGVRRRDILAVNMAIVGFIAGGLGFSGGQCVQAYHAWHPEVFTQSAYAEYFSKFNWWNMMETSFGMIFGAVIAFGLWCNQRWIAVGQADESTEITPRWEFLLFIYHIALLSAAEFGMLRGASLYVQFGFAMGLIPLIGITGGRYWPYLLPLPALAFPIAGKTLLGLCYKGNSMVTLLQEKFSVEDAEKWAKPVGWLVYLVIPMLVMFIAALWLERRGRLGMSSRRMASVGLLLTGWLFFSLNHAFFDFPSLWAPVEEWGGRTPNALIFSVCIVCLTIAAVWGLVNGKRERRV